MNTATCGIQHLHDSTRVTRWLSECQPAYGVTRIGLKALPAGEFSRCDALNRRRGPPRGGRQALILVILRLQPTKFGSHGTPCVLPTAQSAPNCNFNSWSCQIGTEGAVLKAWHFSDIDQPLMVDNGDTPVHPR